MGRLHHEAEVGKVDEEILGRRVTTAVRHKDGEEETGQEESIDDVIARHPISIPLPLCKCLDGDVFFSFKFFPQCLIVIQILRGVGSTCVNDRKERGGDVPD